MATSPPGIWQQVHYDRLVGLERWCTERVNGWLAEAFALKPITNAHIVLSLDVDGVLEDDGPGFSSVGVASVAALRLLELGHVGVVINTARSLSEVQQRVEQFRLLGGVASLGAALFDGVFGQEEILITERGAAQLSYLRKFLRANWGVVIDSSYGQSLRVSRIVEGTCVPIAGPDARRLLDQQSLSELTFLVAPHHTDFVDRNVDKGAGVVRLQQAMGLASLSLAAMGDAACDIPMLRVAAFAFLPAATLPGYIAPRRQRLFRSRHLGAQALWEAACQLVPSVPLQARVLATMRNLTFPDWFPPTLRRSPLGSGYFRAWLQRWRPARPTTETRHLRRT